MTSQSISELLSQVSTVASVKASTLGMSRLDKGASKEAERSHNSMSGIAKVNVSRLAGAEDRVKELVSLQRDGRQVLIDITTAWGDRRLLPNTLIEKFMGQWMPIKKTFEEKVNTFIYDAPQLIENALMNKGSFAVDIPDMEEIKQAFKLEFELEPVPDVSKFNSNILDKDFEAEMKRRFEANIEAAYTTAQADAVHRVAKPLEKLIERMNAYSQKEIDNAKGLDTKGQGFFRDTVITNIQEIADVFGQWNLTADPVMQSLDDALSAFGGIEAEDLRKHADLREDTARRAQKILDDIRAGGFL